MGVRMLKGKLLEFYDKNYLKLLIIPILILLVSIGVIFYHHSTTGNWIEQDISLKGGVAITIPDSKGLTRAQAESLLKEYDVNVRELTIAGVQKGLVIDSGADVNNANYIISKISSKIKLTEDEYTLESVGSSLGQSFFKETITAVIYAFIFMSIVVFICFRIPVPSLAVVLAAFSNMVFTWAVLILLNVKLSASGIAAFLMLIGYSIDTDVLLTSRVLRRKTGTVLEATLGAMKTGMTMTAASLVAVTVSYFFTSSLIIKQIMLILIIGLCIDVVNTWIQNAAILRWYLEKKEKKVH